MKGSYHINRFPASDLWPQGGWSLYQITGDQIAQRIIRNPSGEIVRHPWCGYIGLYTTLPELMAAIEKAEAKSD